MRCGPRRALPHAGGGLRCPRVGAPLSALAAGSAQPAPRSLSPSLFSASSPWLREAGGGGGDARVPPAPAGAGWVLAPSSRGSWVWLREAPGSCPVPGECVGGSHPASSLLGLGVGGGSPLSWSLRGVDVPHPGTRWGIRLGQSQGPQICCRSPGLAASAQILGARMLFSPPARSVAFVPHCAAAVGAVRDPSCPEPPDHAHPSGGSFLILMRNTFSMC